MTGCSGGARRGVLEQAWNVSRFAELTGRKTHAWPRSASPLAGHCLIRAGRRLPIGLGIPGENWGRSPDGLVWLRPFSRWVGRYGLNRIDLRQACPCSARAPAALCSRNCAVGSSLASDSRPGPAVAGLQPEAWVTSQEREERCACRERTLDARGCWPLISRSGSRCWIRLLTSLLGLAGPLPPVSASDRALSLGQQAKAGCGRAAIRSRRQLQLQTAQAPMA